MRTEFTPKLRWIKAAWGYHQRGHMGDIGKTLMFAGAIFMVVGLALVFLGKLPGVGKLPGDIFLKRENFSFYFPLTTCLLLSAFLSLILFFMNRR